jgi:hypothetical protein
MTSIRITTSFTFAALLLMTCHKVVEAFVPQKYQQSTLSHKMALNDYLSSLSSPSFSTSAVLAPHPSSVAPTPSVTRKSYALQLKQANPSYQS